jgi:hypothetical protein
MVTAAASCLWTPRSNEFYIDFAVGDHPQRSVANNMRAWCTYPVSMGTYTRGGGSHEKDRVAKT